MSVVSPRREDGGVAVDDELDGARQPIVEQGERRLDLVGGVGERSAQRLGHEVHAPIAEVIEGEHRPQVRPRLRRLDEHLGEVEAVATERAGDGERRRRPSGR